MMLLLQNLQIRNQKPSETKKLDLWQLQVFKWSASTCIMQAVFSAEVQGCFAKIKGLGALIPNENHKEFRKVWCRYLMFSGLTVEEMRWKKGGQVSEMESYWHQIARTCQNHPPHTKSFKAVADFLRDNTAKILVQSAKDSRKNQLNTWLNTWSVWFFRCQK